MNPRPGWFLARALVALFAASTAWGQQVQISVVPQVPVGFGAVGVAPIAGAALQAGSFRPTLSLPANVVAAPSIANPALNLARVAPVSQLALAAANIPALAELSDLAARVEPTGGRDRSRQLGRYYDRNRGPSAQPIAGAVRAQEAPPSGPTGRALLDQVEAQAKKGHHGLSYDEARVWMFGTGHHTTRGGKSGVLEVYTQTFVPGTSDHGGDYHGVPGGEWDREGMNAEHVWPQSFFAKKLPMRSDLHNLMPTFVHPNSLRGHMPFGEVKGQPEYSNRAGAKLGGGVFEPPPAAKGQIARAILYFVARYRDDAVRQGEYGENFFNDRIEMFLRWNREHPPTPEEKIINDNNARAQGNRNPFIDDYTLADRIGTDGFRFDKSRPNRPTSKEYFDFRPYSNHTAIIETTGMRPHRDDRGQSSKFRSPAAQRNSRR
ncbi:MAG: endonuclease, partial [Elusimicrobia bacterium]|nr:endonuclease [Elusimicrobiota bacterium]